MDDVTRRDVLKMASVAGIVALVAADGVRAAEDKPKDEDMHEYGTQFKEMLAAGDVVQLATASGATSDSITVATDRPGDSRTKDHTVAYVIPDGYLWMSANYQTSHSHGDSAHSDKSNGDPHNGDVFLRVHCSGVGGRARAAVNNAFAATPAVLLKLHNLAIAAQKKQKE